MFYIVIGIVLLLLSAGTIAVMVLFEIRDRRAGSPFLGKENSKSRIPRRFWMLFPEPMNLLVHYGGC